MNDKKIVAAAIKAVSVLSADLPPCFSNTAFAHIIIFLKNMFSVRPIFLNMHTVLFTFLIPLHKCFICNDLFVLCFI